MANQFCTVNSHTSAALQDSDVVSTARTKICSDLQTAWLAGDISASRVYERATAFRSSVVCLHAAELLAKFRPHRVRKSSGHLQDPAAYYAAMLYVLSLGWELDRHPDMFLQPPSTCASSSYHYSPMPIVNPKLSIKCDGETAAAASDSVVVELFRGLAILYRMHVVAPSDTVAQTNDHNAWWQGSRIASRYLRALDAAEQACRTGQRAVITRPVSAYALLILSVASSGKLATMYLQRLASLPSAVCSSSGTSDEDELVDYARAKLLEIKASDMPPPSSTLRDLVQSSLDMLPKARPCVGHSRTTSTSSIVVTPASYCTTPAISHPATPPETTPENPALERVRAPRANSRPVSPIVNPLVSTLLRRERARSHSLTSTPTVSLTHISSSSLGSFSPIDPVAPHLPLPVGMRRKQGVRTQSLGPRCLQTHDTAKRALSAVWDHGTQSQRISARPKLPWRLSIASVGDWFGTQSAQVEHSPTSSYADEPNLCNRAAVPHIAFTQTSPTVPFPLQDTTPPSTSNPSPLTPKSACSLDAALARQERCSKVLGAVRECAVCRASGAGFPACARGCGLAWCSRECRLEGRAEHPCAAGKGKGRAV